MSLQVRTMIRPSAIHGIGLFADEFIPKGTITWKRGALDFYFSPKQLEVECESVVGQYLKYSYYCEEKKLFILCGDDQRFINHSDKPNIISTPDCDVAARDIEDGEELTCDYEEYEPGWFKRRGLIREEFKEVKGVVWVATLTVPPDFNSEDIK